MATALTLPEAHTVPEQPAHGVLPTTSPELVTTAGKMSTEAELLMEAELARAPPSGAALPGTPLPLVPEVARIGDPTARTETVMTGLEVDRPVPTDRAVTPDGTAPEAMVATPPMAEDRLTPPTAEDRPIPGPEETTTGKLTPGPEETITSRPTPGPEEITIDRPTPGPVETTTDRLTPGLAEDRLTLPTAEDRPTPGPEETTTDRPTPGLAEDRLIPPTAETEPTPGPAEDNLTTTPGPESP